MDYQQQIRNLGYPSTDKLKEQEFPVSRSSAPSAAQCCVLSSDEINLDKQGAQAS